MMNMHKNAITIKKALLIFAIIIFAATCIAGCGAKADINDKTEGIAESSFRKQMADAGVTEIEVKKDMVLEAPLEVNGTKVLYGEGSITAVGDAWAGDEYMIVVPSGAQLTVKGSVSIDANGVAGGIHAAKGAAWTIEETACVSNASAKAANTLVEGVFRMNGGTVSGAKGHNVYNKGEVTVTAGEIVGSGNKYAGIYSEGTLTQDGGTIRGAYNNVAVQAGSFTFNGGNNQDSVRDGIFVAEGAKLSVTAKAATITGSGVRGIYLCGEATIDKITLEKSGDTLLKVGKNGVLNLKGGTLADAGYHGVENAGKMVMTGGTIRNSYNCGIVNTGTLELTGGSLLDNVKNKGVLNKHDGKATIASSAVMFSGNRFAIGNEDQAVLDLSKAEFLLTTTTNVYAYGGTVNIHDISLGAAGSNNVRIYRAEVTMTNVQVLGNSSSGSASTHGILLEGGVLKATDLTVKNVTGYGIRNKGGHVTIENLLISKSIKAGGISNMLQDHTGAPGIMDIKNLTVENIRYNNVVVEGGTLTITNGKLSASGTNNVKVTDGTLKLNKVDVLGNQADVAGTNHAVYCTGGTIEAEDVKITGGKITGLRVNGETAVIKGKNVKIENNSKYAIDLTVGQISFDKLSTKGNHYNITNNGGNIKLSNSTLGATLSNNVRIYKGTIDLQNVTVAGHTKDHTTNVHALFVSGGDLTGKNVTVQNVANVGLRVSAGTVNLQGLTVNDAGTDGVWISDGKATLRNLVVKKAGGAGVSATGTGDITVVDSNIINTVSHGAKSENEAKLNLKNTSVAIATTAGRHAVLAQGGDVHLEDVKITGNTVNLTGFGIRINRDTSHVTGKNVHIENVDTGVNASAGTSDIFGVTTENIISHSAYASGTSKIVISDSQFGVSGTNNAKAEKGGVLTLNNVVVEGTAKNHGIIVENDGYVYGKNITVRNTAGCAIRVKCNSVGSHVIIDGLVTENVGTHNIYINKDKDADNLGGVMVKNGDLCNTANHSVCAEAGNLTLVDTKVQGHVDGTENNIHAIYVSGQVQKVSLESVTVESAAGDALRIAAGDVQATDFVSEKTGRNGIWADGGKLTAKNTTVSDSPTGVKVSASGEIVLNGANIAAEKSNIDAAGGKLTVNGYADGSKSLVGASKQDNIKISGGSVVRLNNVDVDKSATNNIVATGGKVYLTDATVTGGNYSVLVQDAGYAELKNVTVTDPAQDALRVNRADGEIVVSGVEIVSPVRYGVSVEKGKLSLTGALTITGKDNKSRALYVYNGGSVTANESAKLNISGVEYGVYVEGSASAVSMGNVTIGKCAKNGVFMAAGTAVLNGTAISESGAEAIKVSGGELTVNGYADGSKSQIGSSKDVNIRSITTGIVRLNNVNILAPAAGKNNVLAKDGGKVYVKDSAITGGNYSVLTEVNGYANLENVTISNPATDGIRTNNATGEVVVNGVTITNPVRYGISVQKGKLSVTGGLTITSDANKSKALYIHDGGKVTATESASLSVSGVEYGVYVEGSATTVALHNVTIGTCVNTRVYVTGGTVSLTGANLANGKNSVYVSGGELTINGYADGSKSQIGTSTQDNITATGTGVVRLNDVNVLASTTNNVVAINGGTVHMKNVTVNGGKHSVLADKNGKVYLTNVGIKGSASSGIRANHSGSFVEGTNVTIENGNDCGLSIKCGTVTITNITIRNNKGVGVYVPQADSAANVTLNNLVTENCGTNAIYTSGASANVTINGATLSNDGSDHVVNLNGGPMVLNDVTINGANLASGKYELYSGAGWLTIGGEMDANIYIVAKNPNNANSGRIVKVNKALTGNKLVIDWATTPVGTALEFTNATILNASKNSITLGSVQGASKMFEFGEKTAKLVAKG